jgi:hypothetical protein
VKENSLKDLAQRYAKNGHAPATATAFRKVLERKDVDIIVKRGDLHDPVAHGPQTRREQQPHGQFL